MAILTFGRIAGEVHLWLGWMPEIDCRLVLAGDTFISEVSLYDGPDGQIIFLSLSALEHGRVTAFRTWDSKMTFEARRCGTGLRCLSPERQ